MPIDDALVPPVSPGLARAALLDVIGRMSDADVVALWRLICSWVLEPPRPKPSSAPIRITDLGQPAEEEAATLQDAMTLLVARYPEAVFSDIEWTEPTIWVWPSNAASQDADPARAIAWLRQSH
jgi:hypothetical protein